MKGLLAVVAIGLGFAMFAPIDGYQEPTADVAGQSGVVQTDFITPGTWHVSSSEEYILAWAHNGLDTIVEVDWSLAGLPDDWVVGFDNAGAALAPNGNRDTVGYPDWARTLVALQVPDGVSGEFPATLHAGPASRDVLINVAEERTDVTAPGSQVTVAYRGSFTDNGEEFDSGEFPTILGSGQTVAGFDYGLMGLAKDETATIVLPPAYGYGYDIPDGHRLSAFNGRSLTFEVTPLAIE